MSGSRFRNSQFADGIEPNLLAVSPSLRWRIVSLYSCMYLPFAWFCGSDVIQGIVKQGSLWFLPLLAAAPALLGSL